MEKFKCHVSFTFCQLKRITRLLPWAFKCAHAKHVGSVPAEGMPVARRETQVIFHTFTQNQFIWIVMAEGEWISRLSTFETNAFKLVEIGLHNELRNQCMRRGIGSALILDPLLALLNYVISHCY